LRIGLRVLECFFFDDLFRDHHFRFLPRSLAHASPRDGIVAAFPAYLSTVLLQDVESESRRALTSGMHPPIFMRIIYVFDRAHPTSR
jgi:hypothetical protein